MCGILVTALVLLCLKLSRPRSPKIRTENSPSSPFLPVLLILFFGSGCAALIYEMVWYQMLQLAIGSTAVSMGVLLATFMGGLCIGSIGLPRCARTACIRCECMR